MYKSLILTYSLTSSVFSAEFQFTGPKIMELDQKTKEMVTGDLDNDGRVDLIIANNKEMKLECLYQRTEEELNKEAKKNIDTAYIQPIYSDLPFLRKQVLLGEFVFSLNTLDFDNDGKRDIVYVGKTKKLTVLFQSDKGKWDDSWSYDESEVLEYGGTLSVADINDDGKDDLAVLNKGNVQIYFSNGTRNRPAPISYAVSVDDAQKLDMVDIDNDGLLDIVYFSQFHPYAMRFRLQQKNGRFGAEIAVPIKAGSTDWENYSKPGEPFKIATISKNLAEIDIQSVERRSKENLTDNFLQAHMFHVPTAGKLSSVFTTGDFNGDSLTDVVAADPNGASLYLYLKMKNGSYLPPTQYATYSGVTSIDKIRVKGEDRDSLLICSGKERIAGIAKYEKNAIRFPENLQMSGTILLSSALDINEDGNHEVVILEQTGRRYKLHIQNLTDSDLDFEIPLGSIKREPTHFIIKDFNNDNVKDIALVTPREAMRVFLRNDEQKLTEFKDESGLLQGQFLDVLPSQINVFDYDGDGEQEWILTKPGYMRSYRIEGDKLSIVGQCNAREEGDEISGPVLLSDKADSKNTSIYAYDQKNLSMQVFTKGDDGVFRYSYMSKIGRIDLQYAENDTSDQPAALVFGRHSFWYVPFSSKVYANKAEKSLTTNVKKANFQKIAIADLNNDKSRDIVAIDGIDGFMEIFSYDESNEKWNSILHFKIFEDVSGAKPRGASRYEPREISIADFNNDGKNDIALLCHDKVLIYTQK